MSGERRGTQPPQEERPAAPRIAEEGESSRVRTVVLVVMKKIITDGRQK